MKHTRLAATISVAALVWPVTVAMAQQIEAGDKIQILVLDDDALSVPAVQVQDDGAVYHPLLGELQVAGQDRVSLAQQIAEMLKDEIREPRVAVNIVEKHPLPVAYVLGEVNAAGPHPILGTGTVREMLVQAGGVTERAAANRTVLITASGERRVVDLGAGLEAQADPESLPVAAGDAIFVPAQNALAVVGAVAKPGSVYLPDSAALGQALAAAGGLVPEADEQSIHLLRGKERVHLPADDAKTQLAEGDVITVGRKEPPRMTVLGEVSEEGTYPMADGSDVAGLLAAGGGPTEEADLARVKLLREGAPSATLDLRELLLSGASVSNIPLEDGDTLIVPTKLPARVTVWGMVKLPGMYDLEEGNRLFEVIARAGGPTEKGEKHYAVVVRAGDRIARQLPLLTRKATADGTKLAEDMELEDGDMVFIPARGDRIEWRDALTALGVITLMIDRL